MVDAASLRSLLAFEKSLFDSGRDDDSTVEGLAEILRNLSTRKFSPDILQFYSHINSTIKRLLLQDKTEAKFRLRHAVINNNLLFVAIYLRHTRDVDTMDENKQSPLHWSTTAEMVHLLLSYGANLHHLAESGRTALHNCSTVEATEALLLAGTSYILSCPPIFLVETLSLE